MVMLLPHAAHSFGTGVLLFICSCRQGRAPSHIQILHVTIDRQQNCTD
uniref:Uncharacterized protein n=1 Tax=Anguilla anguilla TaxID=7936 RepID=A0A0E9QZ42_ANGAN